MYTCSYTICIGMPTGKHIRHIRLELNKKLLHESTRKELKNNLKGLLICRNNRSLRLEIFLLRANSAVDVLRFLHLLRATYAALSLPNISLEVAYERQVRGRWSPQGDTREFARLDLAYIFKLPQEAWKDEVFRVCTGVGKLRKDEKGWLGFRKRAKDRDVWARVGDEGLEMLDPRGRNIWTIEKVPCGVLWGECWDEEHWHEGRCVGRYGTTTLPCLGNGESSIL